jgi:hypothetical protein
MTDQLTPTPAYVPVPLETKGSNGLVIAGFVLVLLGALSSFIPLVNIFGDLLALLGLIFGIIGLVKSRSKGSGGRVARPHELGASNLLRRDGIALIRVGSGLLPGPVTYGSDRRVARRWARGRSRLRSARSCW